MKKARAILITDLMLKDNFAEGRSLSEGMARSVRSREFRERAKAVHCSYEAEQLAEGLVALRYVTEFEGLTQPLPIKHKYSFPLANEQRETGFIVTPESPVAKSETLVGFRETKRSYVNMAVHDSENFLLHADVVVYNRNGKVSPYQGITEDKFGSPLHVEAASLAEAADELGRRVLRLQVTLGELRGPTTLKIGYNTNGIQLTKDLILTPESPTGVHDLLLEENSSLLPGDWVLGVADERDRLVANAVLALEAELPR